MGGLIELDRREYQAAFARAPLAVRHTLVGHPLLKLDALADLADRLPDDQVEHNLGNVPEVLAGGAAPQLDLPPGDIARGIETNGCWMVLKRIEADPAYRDLLFETLEDATAWTEGREGAIVRREGYVFLSSANSTTPLHIDPEHNFLLQVRGDKEMNVGEFSDEHSRQRELERYFSGGHRNLDKMPGAVRTFKLGPGDGVYVPVAAPHFVKTHETTSISLSVTFYTEQSERNGVVHSINARMRRLNLDPSAPGRRPGVDRAKAAVWRVARRAGGRGAREAG